MLCDSLEGRDGVGVGGSVSGHEAHGEGDLCVLRADPHCCMVETNRT